MAAINRFHRALALRALPTLIALSALVLGPGQAAFASDGYVSGTTGYDISFPQCTNVSIPDQVTVGAPYQFAIIGVNRGRAFTKNDCLAREYQYVASKGIPVAFVINLNSPRGALYGQINTASTCSPSDVACLNYNYGWSAAADSYSYTRQTLQDLGESTVPTTWWMDIEVANYWSPNTSLNAQVIQGAIDYFDEQVSGSTMGIYSVRSMWNRIVGSSYLPGVPAWLAGARSLAGASRFCNQTSFTGGPVTLVQYTTRFLDIDYAC